MRLSDFSVFLEGEGDCVVNFRAALRKALGEAASLNNRAVNPKKIRDAISQIRGDVVEPALAQMNIRYKNIATTKAFGVTGATVSTLALSLSMLVNPTLLAAVAVVGSGGLLASLRELEDHKKQNAAIRENPWYLLWKLRRENGED
jgi:hypothetical protein